MKTAIILYGSHTPLTVAHQQITLPGYPHRSYYIRAERVSVRTLGEALDRARPIDGETVLNTVWPDPDNFAPTECAACGSSHHLAGECENPVK